MLKLTAVNLSKGFKSLPILKMIFTGNNMSKNTGEIFTDADDYQYECMNCKHIGSDWYETDTIKSIVEVDANMMLCPKCHSEHYFTYEGLKS